jgi:hypothetical protein
MAIKRITISVPEEVARRIKKAAGARPVSAWLADLAVEHLDDEALERQWDAFYADVNPSKTAVRRAKGIISRLGAGGRRRGAA